MLTTGLDIWLFSVLFFQLRIFEIFHNKKKGEKK